VLFGYGFLQTKAYKVVDENNKVDNNIKLVTIKIHLSKSVRVKYNSKSYFKENG